MWWYANMQHSWNMKEALEERAFELEWKMWPKTIEYCSTVHTEFNSSFGGLYSRIQFCLILKVFTQRHWIRETGSWGKLLNQLIPAILSERCIIICVQIKAISAINLRVHTMYTMVCVYNVIAKDTNKCNRNRYIVSSQ